jgi:hypothetical protein
MLASAAQSSVIRCPASSTQPVTGVDVDPAAGVHHRDLPPFRVRVDLPERGEHLGRRQPPAEHVEAELAVHRLAHRLGGDHPVARGRPRDAGTDRQRLGLGRHAHLPGPGVTSHDRVRHLGSSAAVSRFDGASPGAAGVPAGPTGGRAHAGTHGVHPGGREAGCGGAPTNRATWTCTRSSRRVPAGMAGPGPRRAHRSTTPHPGGGAGDPREQPRRLPRLLLRRARAARSPAARSASSRGTTSGDRRLVGWAMTAMGQIPVDVHGDPTRRCGPRSGSARAR